MSYTVEWAEEAEAELAAIWTAGPDRAAVTRAADALDQRLRTDPSSAGESRPGGRRVVFETPLGVSIAVDDLSRTVTVFRVWRSRRPRP